MTVNRHKQMFGGGGSATVTSTSVGTNAARQDKPMVKRNLMGFMTTMGGGHS